MRFGKVVSIERTAAFLAVMFVFSVRPAFPAGPDDFATAKAMYEKRLFNVSYQYFHDFILTYPDSRNAGEAQFYLGESLFALGDYERAITEYRLAVVNYPESLSLPRASIRLGDCFDHLGDAVKAVYYYKKAVNRAVDSDDIYDGYSKLGGLYFKQGDYSAAIDTYNGFINNYGIKDTPGTIYYRLALCYYLISDYKSTETALNEAAGSDFDDPALLSYVMGRVDYKQGSLENAVEHFETALSDGTNSPVYSDLLFQYGVTLAATGDYEASIGIVEEATQGEMDGDLRAGFLYLSGYSLFNTGDWTGARAALMQSLEIKPDIATSEEAEFLIAESLMESGEYEEAELKYRTIVEKGNRWSQQAMYRLAWLAFGNGDMRTAYDRFGDAGVHPGELAPYCSYWQAECLLRMGDEYEGLNQLKYILKEMPESPLADNALFRFAKILIKTGSTDEGIANLSLLIDRYDESALCDDSAYLIARTYSDQKRYDEAISGYYELISSYPDSSYVSQAYYDIGMIYYDTRDYDKAVTVFDSIVSVYPESDVADDALYQSGFCELARSNYKAALSVFEELARLFPNSPLVDDALYRVEMCRYEMGEYSSEIEAAKVYVRKYPASSLCCGLYIKIARYYDRTGTRKKAEKYYLLAEETAKTLEERYDARRYLAEYYIGTGRTDAALETYERMLEDGGDYREEAALYRMAEVAEDKGDDAAALSYYSRIINDFPDGEYRASAMLRSGNGLRKLKMYEESNATLLQFLAEYPGSKNANVARFYIAFNYQRIGEYGEAIKYHKSVATYGRRSLAVQSYYWLGVCKRDIGEPDAARSYFAKVINNYQDFPDWVRRAETELGNM